MTSIKNMTRPGASSRRPAGILKRLAIVTLLVGACLIASSPIYAQSSPTVEIPREDYVKLVQAVDELIEARKLIAAFDRERAAAAEADKIRDRKETLLTSIADLAKKEAEAERRASIALERALQFETRRADLLEKEVRKRSGGKLSTILKVGAIVLGIVAIAK